MPNEKRVRTVSGPHSIAKVARVMQLSFGRGKGRAMSLTTVHTSTFIISKTNIPGVVRGIEKKRAVIL